MGGMPAAPFTSAQSLRSRGESVALDVVYSYYAQSVTFCKVIRNHAGNDCFMVYKP